MFSRLPDNLQSIRQYLTSITVLLLIATIPLFYGCNNFIGTSSGDPDIVTEYDFNESKHSWDPFFTDYNIEQGEDMELTAEYRSLPEPLNTDESGHFISAINRSDDVKMLYRKEVEGLEPNTTYNVGFDIHFATEVPSGCAGIGGPPGEAVRIIADASEIKPEPFVDDMDWYRLNIQHLNDSAEWYQRVQLGDIANSRECEDGYEYEIKELSSNVNHATVTSDENGRAWLMFGTRSGFEGQTDLYYTYFRADFRER